MTKNLYSDGLFQCKRKGILRIHYDPAFTLETILENLASPGTIIKKSIRSEVRQVSDWTIKESQGNIVSRFVRHTFQYQNHRRHWDAACYLTAQGIRVPRPIAFIEKCLPGLHFGNTLISETLEGQRNVEQFMFTLIQHGVGKDTLIRFLDNLATAINGLVKTGAYHADLSGKNIFTRDGDKFWFIDLDAVILNEEYTDDRRLRNHIQLYDSFCDQISDHLLVPFITQILPGNIDARVWMPKVREGQKERRRRIEAIWEKQGKTRPNPGMSQEL